MTASTVPGFTNRQLWMVLGSLMLAVFLASMEISIISTALPTIVGEFESFESFAWVGTVYIVTAAIGTPLFGKFSDLFGRRTVFQATLALFIVGSLLCGLAQSMGQLIAFRAVQGLGGGAIQALAFAILGDILPPRERGRYIGYFTLSFVGAAVAGPVIGGCHHRAPSRGRGSSSSTYRSGSSPAWSPTSHCSCRSRAVRPGSTGGARRCSRSPSGRS